MSIHVMVDAAAEYSAQMIEPLPGMCQLVIGNEDSGLVIQIPSRIGGLVETAHFSRALSNAANEFADWCEAQEKNRSTDS